MLKVGWLKVLSLFLVLVLLINMLPLGVFAQQVQADDAAVESEYHTPADNVDVSEAEIVNELMDKRDAYTKTFRMSNGLNMAVSYSEPVHYETDAGWEEIDNSLQKTADGRYTNTAGDWNVSFPEQLSGGNSVEIQKNGYTLSFSLTGQLHSDAMRRAAGYRMEQTGDSYARKQQPKADEFETPQGYEQTVLPNLHSQLAYADVYENTDVVYDLVGGQLKESIVLESYDASLQGYSYILTTGDMLPVLEEDGQITLYDPNQEEVILVMPAPYLLDNANTYCGDVQVQISGSNGRYILTYLLPTQWLAEEERAWPVVLDPIVKAELNANNILDRSVCSGGTTSDIDSQQDGTLDCGYNAKRGQQRFYLKYASLPTMKSSETVVEAVVYLRTAITYSGTVPVTVHKVLDTWEPETLAWNNQPQFRSIVEDYCNVGASSVYTAYSWNVTDIVRDWYAEDNTGMMFQVPTSITDQQTTSLREFCSSDYGSEVSRPTLFVYYRDTSGIESYYSYQTLSAGHAGSAYISDSTGRLNVVRQLAGYSSTVNPFTLNMVYNADFCQIAEKAAGSFQNIHGIDMQFGKGITWDMIQSIEEAELENAYGKYLVWHDGDGTNHYFLKQSDGKYIDEDGLNLTIEKSGSDYTMTDDKGNKWLFDDGLLYKYQDESGNTTVIQWIGSGSSRYFYRIYQQNYGQTTETDLVNVTYVSGTSYINKLTDAAGRVYTFVYNNGNLTGIKLGDIQIAKYDYSSGHLVGMLDLESNYWLWFTYSGGKVANYQEWIYNGPNIAATPGAAVSITYGEDTTTYRDHGTDREINTADDIVTQYTFDYWGRTVGAYSTDHNGKLLGASNAAYSGAGETTNPRINNRTMQTATAGTAAENLLTNHSFESGTSGWKTPNGSGNTEKVQASTYTSHSGYKSLEYYTDQSETGGSIAASTSATLEGNTTYTLSAYVDTSWIESYGNNGGVRLIADNGNDGEFEGEYLTHSTEAMPGKWTRISLTFKTTTVGGYYTLIIQAKSVTGWIYVDDVQLEKGEAPSNYNLVENGNLELGNSGWLMQSGTSYSTESPYDSSNDLISMVGNLSNVACAWQNVRVNAPGSQTYVLSGWAWADSVADDDNAHSNENYAGNTSKSFGLRATVRYTDNTEEHHYVPFCPDVKQWQFASLTVVPKEPTKTVGYIQVVLAYEKNANIAWFDRISLVKEAAQSMRYDEDGNLISVTTTGMSEQTAEYENGNLIKAYTGGSGTYTYEYGTIRTHLVTSVDDGVVKQSYTYDGYGNVKSTTLTNKNNSNAGSLTTSASYSNNGNLQESVTDANGNEVWYYYGDDQSKQSGAPTSVCTAVPGTGGSSGTATAWQYTNNTYDTYGRTSSVTLSNLATLHYTYTKGLLTGVSRNSGQTYNFEYDAWGNRTNVKVGSRQLASYTYAENNGQMTSMRYGNKDKVEYTYDDLGRVIKEVYSAYTGIAEDGTETYTETRTLRYTYTGDGQLHSIHDSSTGKYYFYTYDTLGRVINSAAGSMRADYRYDDYARLVRRSFVDKVLGDGIETYTYDADTANSISDGTLRSMRMVSGGNIVYQYDGLQRLTNKDIAGEVWETFTYSNTQVSSKINYIGDTRVHSLHYLYDGNGNITKETLSEGGVQTSRNYAYDKLNQLTQVKKDGVVKETYAYDNAGNITSFNNGSTQNHTLVYGDAQWKDLLTEVDGEAITYDAIGNPLTYHNGSGYSFTWAEGRRLTSATKAEQTTAYTYDYTGLRTKKTNADGTYTVYHIADGRYVGETLYRADGSRRLYIRYIYDENDSIVGISLWKAGISGAWEDYYFLKNLQGDVLRVYRASDNSLAAEYTYDAWGNIVASQNYQNFDGIAVSQLNPFRYRGYYFDNETNFYYLQSRYYDPAIGRFINADVLASTGQGVLGYNMFAYCGNNPANMVDSDGKAGKYFELGKGWLYRIDAQNTTTGTRRHIKIWNNQKGVSYAQNDDGSPHDKGSNSKGKLPNWLNKKLIEKTGWDYNGNRESFYDNTDYKTMVEGIQYNFADGTTVFRENQPFKVDPYSINACESAYFQGNTSAGSASVSPSTFYLPIIGPITLPSFSFGFSGSFLPLFT